MPTPSIGLIGVTFFCILSIGLSIFSIIDLDDSKVEHTYKTIWRGGQTALTLAKMGLWFYVWFIIFKHKDSVLYKNTGYQRSIFLFAITSALQFVANFANCFITYGKGDWVKIVKTIIEILNIFLSSIDLICGISLITADATGESLDGLEKKSSVFKFVATIKRFGQEINDGVRGNVRAEMKQQAKMINNPLKIEKFGERQRRRNPSKRRKKRK